MEKTLNPAKVKKINEIYQTLPHDGEVFQGNDEVSEYSMAASNAAVGPGTHKAAKPNKKNVKAANADTNDDKEIGITATEQEVEDFIKAEVGEIICNNLNDQKWNIRKDGFTALAQFITNNLQKVQSNQNYYLKFISMKNKNFKENIFKMVIETERLILKERNAMQSAKKRIMLQ